MQLIKNYLRILKIIYILAKHDALSVLRRLEIAPITTCFFSLISYKGSKDSEGTRIARALEELGPLYIKIGQSISTRSDIIGNQIAEDLSHLRDKLPSFPFKIAKKILETELNASIEDLFLEFDHTPIAAASIAQVHKAKTTDGMEVAVKILRPGIEQAFKQDIELFYYIAAKLEKKLKNPQRFRALEIVKNFESAIKTELDLRLEAASSSELKENALNDENLFIPEINWERTSERVLTSEWIDGTSIYDINKLLEKKFNLDELAKKLALIFFNQAFKDGVFHADLHPGNILVMDNGKIALIDFGIIGRIDDQLKVYVAEILYGFSKKDYKYVAKVHFDAGFIKSDKSIELFAQSCRAIGEPIIGMPVNKVSIARLLANLFKIAENFDMQIQPNLIPLQKTMMLVEGIGYKLNSNINMWKLVEPWIEEWAVNHIGIEAKIMAKIKKVMKVIINEFNK